MTGPGSTPDVPWEDESPTRSTTRRVRVGDEIYPWPAIDARHRLLVQAALRRERVTRFPVERTTPFVDAFTACAVAMSRARGVSLDDAVGVLLDSEVISVEFE